MIHAVAMIDCIWRDRLSAVFRRLYICIDSGFRMSLTCVLKITAHHLEGTRRDDSVSAKLWGTACVDVSGEGVSAPAG